jgi:glycosyltransferase involved in cell wall biosynthesis
MKFCIFGWNFPILLGKALEKDGHIVIFNNYAEDADVIIIQSLKYIYPVYRKLKNIRKNRIKLVNFVLDIPPWRFEDNFYQNSLKNYIRTRFFDIFNRKEFFYDKITKFVPNDKKGKIYNICSSSAQTIFNKNFQNKFTYNVNYRNFLKNSDLNLAISRYSQHLIKRFMKINCELCYLCVDSDLLSSIPTLPKKYDAINISRIVQTKRQEVFVEAANRLGLNILVIGKHQDKKIKLNCPTYYIPDTIDVLKKLSESRFYVDASIYEGFGMTPIEAAYLNKIAIVSDTYVHKEILGEYPLYFKRNNVDDLINKMKMVLDGEYKLNKKSVQNIREKYSIQTVKQNLMKYVESLF